ncbi:hypothetical protein AAVH_32489, partial [Aphelenchoides avenae]
MAGVAVRRRTRSASPRAHRVLRDGQELDVRRKKGDARYAHPIVDTPPSKPVTVVCEQPKPSKVTMPKKAEAASELLILFNTQAASTVLKDRAVHGGGDVEVRTAVQQPPTRWTAHRARTTSREYGSISRNKQ